MNENENEIVTETTDNSVNYIEAIKNLKASTVSKDEYEKLKAENKQLFDSLVNGQTIEAEVEKEPIDVDAIRKHLFGNHGEDVKGPIDYMSNILTLREALMAKGEPDPFYGGIKDPSPELVELAPRAAQIYQECLEEAHGDDGVFIALLQSRTQQEPISKRKK